MRRIAWAEPEPGHFEVDLVHHGGPEPVGEYAYTLQLVDVATGWSERVAVLGRSQRAMEAALLVRAYLRHGRLDMAAQVDALNALYDDMWLYYNGFQPVLHLVEKAVDPHHAHAAAPPLG
jgi:hypothetical protein